MYLSKIRYEEIKEEVYKVFRDYEIKSFPIDFKEVSEKMGIKLIKYSSLKKDKRKKFLDISKDGLSYLSIKERCFIIYYNDDTTWQRIRFTVMHEIGHVVLGHKEYSEKNEAEANFFARSALAPIVLLLHWNITELEDIVSMFDISYEAAQYIKNNCEKRQNSLHKEYAEYEIEMIKLFER